MIPLKGKRIFVLTAIFTSLIIISGSASAATLYVKEGGTSPEAAYRFKFSYSTCEPDKINTGKRSIKPDPRQERKAGKRSNKRETVVYGVNSEKKAVWWFKGVLYQWSILRDQLSDCPEFASF